MFAAASSAIVLLAGCGSDGDSGATETTTTTTASQGSGLAQIQKTINGNGATTIVSDEVDDDLRTCENTVCEAFVVRDSDGRLVLCSRLEVVPESVAASTQTTTETETGVSTTETQTDEATTETETVETADTKTVHSLRCAGGTRPVPVEGLELAEVSEVQTSDDGEATWTAIVVGVKGKIVDGTLVADE